MMHPAVLMTLYKRVRTKDCFYVCYRLLLVMFFMVSERVQLPTTFLPFSQRTTFQNGHEIPGKRNLK